MKRTSYFRGKTVLITGASSGIGYATALKFASFGAKLVLVARRENKLKELKAKVEELGVEALVFSTDVSKKKEVQSMVEKAIDAFGKIDILVVNAGQYIQSEINSAKYEDFEQSMAVNFYGIVYSVKCVLPFMLKEKSGHIAIVNSLDAKKGIVGDGPYVVAKCALVGFGDVLRQEVKPFGINVTSIFPARIDTPMVEGLKVPKISPKIKVDKVVKAIVNGIKRKSATVYVPGNHLFIGVLNDLFPKSMDKLYRKFKLEGEWEK